MDNSRISDNLLLEMLDKLYILAHATQESIACMYEGCSGEFFKSKAKEIRKTDVETFLDPTFFDLKREASKRGLNWASPTIRQVDLTQRGSLERHIVGALRDTINAHGNISRESAPSAGKRIIGAIKTFNHRRSNA